MSGSEHGNKHDSQDSDEDPMILAQKTVFHEDEQVARNKSSALREPPKAVRA